MQLIQEISSLLEERDPTLKYTNKFVKTRLDRVIVELEGNKSGAMSRLTSRYARLDKAAKLMKERRDELNIQMKAVADNIFEAEDAVYTRVIDTVSFTITLSKAEKAENKEPTKVVDYESIAKELEKLIPQELQAQIEAITKRYTELKAAVDTPTKLTVKSKVSEGVAETLAGFAKRFGSFLKSMLSWGNSYDKKLAALKKRAGV